MFSEIPYGMDAEAARYQMNEEKRRIDEEQKRMDEVLVQIKKGKKGVQKMRGGIRFEKEIEVFAAKRLGLYKGTLEDLFDKNMLAYWPKYRLLCGEIWPFCGYDMKEPKEKSSGRKPITDFFLTNHELCHEMFRNAYYGRSRMYIQIQNLCRDEEPCRDEDLCRDEERPDWESESGYITLSCSLLTLQMLDYDTMMFRAMSNETDLEYAEAARQYYRPYLFGFVVELSKDKYEELRQQQERLAGDRQGQPADGVQSPYLWMRCAFSPFDESPYVELEGYAVESASRITKRERKIYVTGEEEVIGDVLRGIQTTYALSGAALDDDSFTRKLEGNLYLNHMRTVDAYKIGDGNCIFVRGDYASFFYDIGFNYRHRPKVFRSGVKYSYMESMKEICTLEPNFFILSHWDMDHVAGSAVLKKECLEKDWFAPDCHDAYTDARRLAKYLDSCHHLFLAKRPSTGGLGAREIGQIDILNRAGQVDAVYRLYMGEKASCDASYANCEGIVIEYEDKVKEECLLMMGDVNYASFNKARSAGKASPFADTPIDYLIAPHHGSQHTDHELITENDRRAIRGKCAVICCTGDRGKNRPDCGHEAELWKRFCVCLTENAASGKNSIRISI